MQYSKEKLAGDPLLGSQFVYLSILPNLFRDYLYEKFGELRARSVDWFAAVDGVDHDLTRT